MAYQKGPIKMKYKTVLVILRITKFDRYNIYLKNKTMKWSVAVSKLQTTQVYYGHNK